MERNKQAAADFFKKLTGNYRPAVASTMKKYGYNEAAAADPKAIICAYVVHKKPFVDELYSNMCSFSGFVSNPTQQSALAQIFEGATQVLTGTGITANTGTGTSAGTTPTGTTPQPAAEMPKEEPKKILGLPRWAFFGLVIIAVLAIVLYIRKRG